MIKITLIAICLTGISIGKVFSENALAFIENKGQWNSHILFKAAVRDGNLFLEKNAFTWYFSNAAQLLHSDHSLSPTSANLKTHAFKIFFENSNADVRIAGTATRTEYYNYYLGNNPSAWQSRVSAYNSVIYMNLYDGIDLEVYSRNGNLKYDFIIHPGADPGQIKIRYAGLDSVKLHSTQLFLYNSVNTLVEQTPYCYVRNGKTAQQIPCAYLVAGHTVQFQLQEVYDRSQTIVIDPTTLIFSSYSGSTADNWGYSATYDSEGNLYGAGIVFDAGYPVTIGAFEEDFQGDFHFSPAMSQFQNSVPPALI